MSCSGVRFRVTGWLIRVMDSAEQRREQGLLDVQPVFGFVPDARLRALDDLGGDLFAAVRREAVQEDGLAIRELHQVGVHRVAPECEAEARRNARSEEHTSELQSRPHLVCRLLLEKKNKR